MDVCAEIVDATPAAGRAVLVGVDGADGSGKTTFAARLEATYDDAGRPAIGAANVASMLSASKRTRLPVLIPAVLILALLVPGLGLLLSPPSFAGAVPGVVVNDGPESGDNEIVEALEDQLDATASVPAAYGVIDGDEMFAGGRGGADADQPFVIGSVSKSFTALAALTYVDEGELDLDAAVTDYLPEFPLAGSASEPIRIRHLLQHTMGLSFSDCNLDFVNPAETIEERVRQLSDAMAGQEPGAEFEYCNIGYAVLAEVLEEIEGAPFAEILQQRVLDPLGMTRTYTDFEAAEQNDLAEGHQTFMGIPFERAERWPSSALPDGYVLSSVNDMLTYAAFHLGDGTTTTGEQLLTTETLHRMHTETVEIPGLQGTPMAEYALGLFIGEVGGHRIVSHGGDTFRYHADFAVLPDEGRAVVVLAAGQMLSGAPAAANSAMAVLTGESAEPTRMYAIATGVLWVLGLTIAATVTISLIRARHRRREGRLPRKWAAIVTLATGAAVAAAAAILMVVLGDSVTFGLVYLWRAAPDVLMILTLLVAVLFWVGIRALLQRRSAAHSRN